jgi:hypothetical protein
MLLLEPPDYPFVPSGYPFGTFCLPLWYILITLLNLLVAPLVPSGFPFGTFCLSLWYLLIALWYLLVVLIGTFCLSRWYLLITFWYLLITPLVRSDNPFRTF